MDATLLPAEAGKRSEVRKHGQIANSPSALKALTTKLARRGHELRFCYDAGPCGYGIQRQLSAMGHRCSVVVNRHEALRFVGQLIASLSASTSAASFLARLMHGLTVLIAR